MNKYLTGFFIFLVMGAFWYGITYKEGKKNYDRGKEFAGVENVLRMCEGSRGWVWNISINTTSIMYDCSTIMCRNDKCDVVYLKKIEAENVDGRWLIKA